jgi:hypothetical protein
MSSGEGPVLCLHACAPPTAFFAVFEGKGYRVEKEKAVDKKRVQQRWKINAKVPARVYVLTGRG